MEANGVIAHSNIGSRSGKVDEDDAFDDEGDEGEDDDDDDDDEDCASGCSSPGGRSNFTQRGGTTLEQDVVWLSCFQRFFLDLLPLPSVLRLVDAYLRLGRNLI